MKRHRWCSTKIEILKNSTTRQHARNFLILILILLYSNHYYNIFFLPFLALKIQKNRCFRKKIWQFYEMYRAHWFQFNRPSKHNKSSGRIRTKFMMSCRKLAFIQTHNITESSKCNLEPKKNSSKKIHREIFYSSPLSKHNKFPYYL